MRHVCALSLALIMCLAATPAAAANQVVNPGFTTDLSGWTLGQLAHDLERIPRK